MPAAITQTGGLLALNKVYRANWYCVYGNQLGIFGANYIFEGPLPSGATLGDLALACQANIRAKLIAVIGELSYTLGCKVQSAAPGSMIQPGIAVEDTPLYGDLGNLPTQVSSLISLSGALGGRGSKARLYVPFPRADAFNQASGLFSDAYVADLTSLANTIVSPRDWVAPTQAGNPRCCLATAVGAFRGNLTIGQGRPGPATQRRRGAYGSINRAAIT